DPVDEADQGQKPTARERAEHDAERAAAHDRVELVAVQHEQLAAAARRVQRLALHLEVTPIRADEGAQVVVMIAGDVDHAHALAAALHEQLEHLGMALRPEEAVPQAFEIDDVADEIQGLAAHVPQEIEQHVDAACARSEMHVRQKNGAQRPAVAHGRSQRLEFRSVDEWMMRAGSVMRTDMDRKSDLRLNNASQAPAERPRYSLERNKNSSAMPKRAAVSR